MAQRIVQRVATTGHLKLPAVPGLVDEVTRICAEVFAGSGRGFFVGEADAARELIFEALTAAFAQSQRSKIEVVFEAQASQALGFAAKPVVRSVADAYERWIGTSDGPLFGALPDARVVALARETLDAGAYPILDFGAGTGRNALALARRGHPVDAVEITPKFAEMLVAAATTDNLSVRVVADDVFAEASMLRRDYRLVIASEVAPDFRSVADLRQLFKLAATVLNVGGQLLFNVHLCAPGYNPDKAARELAQQCYSALYTPSEVAQAAAGLPLEFVANDSVCDYEQQHLPAEAWPPTTWYVNWSTGLDVFEIEPEHCPVELCWLTFRKTSPNRIPDVTSTALLRPDARPRRFDPVALRKALARRLLRRLSAAGTLTLPAVPGMLETFAALCAVLFRALGREVTREQTAQFRCDLGRVLGVAFAQSQRSNVVLTYEAPVGTELKYTLTADPVPIADAYAQWSKNSLEPIFGWHPDARVLALLPALKPASACPVLDIGAGLGRNSLHLAGLGFPVDAVEIVPVFAQAMRAEATRKALPIHVIEHDIFSSLDQLRRDYQLVVASGTASDFRDLADLRRLVEITAEVAAEGSIFLLGLHVAVDGYCPDEALRQWGQQCCAMFFTREEIAEAMTGLPFTLVSDESGFDYEKAHLPAEAWPPTAVFGEWALGQHMLALAREQCPLEFRWLVFEKAPGSLSQYPT